MASKAASPAATAPNWRAEAARLQIDARAFINGRRAPARSGETFDVLSPIDGKLIARAARGRAEDIDDAVKSARAAFESGVWSRHAPAQRRRILLKWSE